jgi:hypothetical protein
MYYFLSYVNTVKQSVTANIANSSTVLVNNLFFLLLLPAFPCSGSLNKASLTSVCMHTYRYIRITVVKNKQSLRLIEEALFGDPLHGITRGKRTVILEFINNRRIQTRTS